MDKKHRYFELMCESAALMQAWKQVRHNRGAAGVDRVTIAEYERDLIQNLEDLGARLREGRYFPMPLRRFEMEKANGKVRSLGIFTIEDRIAQRAALNLLEPLWEPSFADCSYGFRPGRNAEMAVKQTLAYRAQGDEWIADADIEDCFASLDHEVILGAVGARVRDKRLLNLIGMWLAAGQVFASPDESPREPGVADFAAETVGDALAHLLDDRGYGYPAYPNSYADNVELSAAEAQKAARREAFKRLGRDVALFGLTWAGRRGRLLSPATLALTGAAALATAAYPAASRFVRKQLGRQAGPMGAVQGSALSPLLCNIVLDSFDRQMLRAGYHLVRYADDFVITCAGEEEARRALDFAGRQLAGLRLRLHPGKTRVIRFENGLEFLGYKFDPFLLTATPAPTSSQGPIRLLLRGAPWTVDQLKEKAGLNATRLGRQIAGHARAGAARVTGLFKRK